jgi:hypothetical protein
MTGARRMVCWGAHAFIAFGIWPGCGAQVRSRLCLDMAYVSRGRGHEPHWPALRPGQNPGNRYRYRGGPHRGQHDALHAGPAFADLVRGCQDEIGADDASGRGAAHRAHLRRVPGPRRDRSREPWVRRSSLPLLTLRLQLKTSNRFQETKVVNRKAGESKGVASWGS